jgi:hypothetical protein
MSELEQFKIPVVEGINDNPIPVNYLDNGKGCNGAYFIERFNGLVDSVDPRLTYQSVLQDFEAQPQVAYGVDTSDAQVTATLPEGNHGDLLLFTDLAGTFGTNHLVITPALGDSVGGAGELILNHDQENVTLLYDASINNWLIRGGLVLGGTDDDYANINKVSISGADTTPGFLANKLVEGNNIQLSLGNAGGNEQIIITANVGDPNRVINGNSQVAIESASGEVEITVGGVQSGRVTQDSVFLGNLSGSDSEAGGNVGVGPGSARDLTTGVDNTLLGTKAGKSATTASYNTAAGSGALENVTVADGNTAAGDRAGSSITTGNNNTVFGRFAGETTDNPYSVLEGNLTGNNNLLLGYGALPGTTSASNQIVLGNSVHDFLTAPGVHFALSKGEMSAAIGGQVLTYDAATQRWAPQDTNFDGLDLGTAAFEDVSYFATAAQGAKADTALQLANLAIYENTTQLNARDSANRDRTNHTGTQLSTTISDWNTKLAGTQNTAVYTPTTSYHPATKKYVDDAITVSGGYTNANAIDAVTGLFSSEFVYDSLVPSITLGVVSSDSLVDGTNNKVFTSAEKIKLGLISSGATANDTDANLKNRANHTGTQAISTVDGLSSALSLKLESVALAPYETTTQLNSRDTANRSRANHTGAQAISTVTGLSDALAAKLESDDLAGFETTAQLNSRDTANRSRANHTGTQDISTVDGLSTALSSKVEASALSGFETTAQLNTRDTNNRSRDNHTGTQAISTVTNLQSTLDSKAPLNNAALTGVPTAPTAANATNNTQIATTAFVHAIAEGLVLGEGPAVNTTPVVAVAALSIDCGAGNYFTKTISSNSTFTFSNPPATGTAYAFTLELTHTSGTVTWPASVAWPGGIAPGLTTGKTHLFVFVTDDGGTRWRGAALVDYTN